MRRIRSCSRTSPGRARGLRPPRWRSATACGSIPRTSFSRFGTRPMRGPGPRAMPPARTASTGTSRRWMSSRGRTSCSRMDRRRFGIPTRCGSTSKTRTRRGASRCSRCTWRKRPWTERSRCGSGCRSTFRRMASTGSWRSKATLAATGPRCSAIRSARPGSSACAAARRWWGAAGSIMRTRTCSKARTGAARRRSRRARYGLVPTSSIRSGTT